MESAPPSEVRSRTRGVRAAELRGLYSLPFGNLLVLAIEAMRSHTTRRTERTAATAVGLRHAPP